VVAIVLITLAVLAFLVALYGILHLEPPFVDEPVERDAPVAGDASVIEVLAKRQDLLERRLAAIEQRLPASWRPDISQPSELRQHHDLRSKPSSRRDRNGDARLRTRTGCKLSKRRCIKFRQNWTEP
jgi:hypothetical protein